MKAISSPFFWQFILFSLEINYLPSGKLAVWIEAAAENTPSRLPSVGNETITVGETLTFTIPEAATPMEDGERRCDFKGRFDRVLKKRGGLEMRSIAWFILMVMLMMLGNSSLGQAQETGLLLNPSFEEGLLLDRKCRVGGWHINEGKGGVSISSDRFKSGQQALKCDLSLINSEKIDVANIYATDRRAQVGRKGAVIPERVPSLEDLRGRKLTLEAYAFLEEGEASIRVVLRDFIRTGAAGGASARKFKRVGSQAFYKASLTKGEWTKIEGSFTIPKDKVEGRLSLVFVIKPTVKEERTVVYLDDINLFEERRTLP